MQINKIIILLLITSSFLFSDNLSLFNKFSIGSIIDKTPKTFKKSIDGNIIQYSKSEKNKSIVLDTETNILYQKIFSISNLKDNPNIYLKEIPSFGVYQVVSSETYVLYKSGRSQKKILISNNDRNYSQFNNSYKDSYNLAKGLIDKSEYVIIYNRIEILKENYIVEFLFRSKMIHSEIESSLSILKKGK